MKALLRKFLSLIVPLLIGIGIIYYQFTTLTPTEINNIKLSFLKADYFYIYLSLLVSLVGYWSRAYRWKFALKHLGYQTKFHNDFMTVCVSYLVNLTLPRSGEITRAALLKKYEKVPFDKAFGTVVAERMVDILIFLLFITLGLVSQFDTMYAFLLEKNLKFETLLWVSLSGLMLFLLFIFVWIYAEWKIILTLKQKLSGLLEGMLSIVKMKDKWYYLFHSFLIWFSYLIMFYITIFALPETAHISFDVVLMGFIFGTLAVGFTNGGLGAYPLAVAMIFSLYGISNEIGVAFGWLIWTSQTLLTIFLGLLSYLLLPVVNKK